MKVLWVMNSPIGPASAALGEEYMGSSGGWIQTEYEALSESGISFSFLSTLPSVGYGELVHRESPIGDIFCVHAPKISYGIRPSRTLMNNVQQVIDRVKPDLIHIWGTETWLSNAVANCKTEAPRIIFIQGLIGIHQRYLGGYFTKMKENKLYLRNVSLICRLKDVLRTELFTRQANVEADTIRKCGNVIIDSQFAMSYCSSLGEPIKCYKHVLVPNRVFSQYHWNYDQCEKHTIFTIYGSSAEKGTQQLLKALAIVKRRIPDVKAIIPGGYSLNSSGQLTESKRDGFQQVIFNMIYSLGLENNVVFTGRLNAAQMAEKLSHAHIFVNTSCMEVHALSLREAMTEGVPSISSLCGSTGEYVTSGSNGFLYRFEEYENLAQYIIHAFERESGIADVSKAASESLQKMGNEGRSLEQIYSELVK